MRYYYDHRNRQPVKSSGMRAEEIDQERRMSGWNQYEGEEEPWEENRMQMPVQAMPDRMMPDGHMLSDGQTMSDGQMMSGRQAMQPIFLQPDPAQDMKEQMEIEREWRSLQAMYPETAKMLLPMIEEECDKMEYEGSPMFDAYPDQTTIWQIQARIQKQAADSFPPEILQNLQNMQEEAPEVFSMQYQDGRRRRPGDNWMGDLVRVMLLQEMHQRRCRHNRCRRHRF